MFTYKHSSYAIIISLGAGILTGLYIPVLIPALKALSSIYVTLLKMCVIPIIFSSVSVSFARLIHNNFAFRYFLRLGFLILLMMLCISLIAPLLSLAFPSMLVPNDAITRQLSTIALENDQNSREVHPGFKEISFFTPDDTASERESKISSFIHRLIPQNIFEALSMGETLKVVFYFSLFGISLSSISEKKSHTVLKVLEEIYSISQYIDAESPAFIPNRALGYHCGSVCDLRGFFGLGTDFTSRVFSHRDSTHILRLCNHHENAYRYRHAYDSEIHQGDGDTRNGNL